MKRIREAEEKEAELRRNGLEESVDEEDEEDKDDDDEDGEGKKEAPNEGVKLANELIEVRKKAKVAGGIDHWFMAETMADIAVSENNLREAARYLQAAANGFSQSTLWWHEDSLRCFAKHKKILGRIADIERR